MCLYFIVKYLFCKTFFVTQLGDILFNIFRGPVEILVGIACGVVTGIICWFFPNNDEVGVSRNRFVLLLGINNLFIFGSRAVEFSGIIMFYA